MSAWEGWELGRAVLVFTAVAYVVVWVQLSLYHWAGGFRRRAMWAPVLLTPVVVIGALLGAVRRESPWGWITLVLLALGVVDGLIGLVYHLRGTASQVGGLSVRNVLSGPPPMLPVAYAALGALGVGGLLWNA
jgi:hypothetical protein